MTDRSHAGRNISLYLALASTLVLTMSYSTNAMDRIVFPMLLKWISADYGFDLKSGGFLATVFALGAGLAAWPTGYLIDRWSRKRVAIAGMAVYSVFTAATMISHGFVDMAVYRFITGVGEAMQLAALFTMVCSFFHTRKALMVGIVNLGFGAGNFLGPVLAVKLMGVNDNWRTPFLVYAVVGLVLALCIWIFVPTEFSEKREGPSAVETAARPANGERFLNRNVILCGIAAVCWGLAVFAHLGLYATFLIGQLKLAPASASYALSFLGVGGLFGFAGGFLGDRYSNRWAAIAAWTGMGVCWHLQYHVAQSVEAETILNFFAGFAATSVLHPNAVALLQRSAPEGFIGQATGFFHACGYVAAGFAGLAFGALIQAFGWSLSSDLMLVGLPVIAIGSLSLVDGRALSRRSEPRLDVDAGVGAAEIGKAA